MYHMAPSREKRARVNSKPPLLPIIGMYMIVDLYSIHAQVTLAGECAGAGHYYHLLLSSC